MICTGLLALIPLTSCNTLETRESVGAQTRRPTPAPAPVRETNNPPPEFATPPPVLNQPTQNTGQIQTPPPPPPAATPFPIKSSAKVGLILGPGGMKTFAQLGVLREMNRARIPVHAIAGLEWGAVMGAVYAHQGQINDAEWKAFKLKEDNLPEAGFLSSRAAAAQTSKLTPFFEAAFANSTVDKARIPFACAAATKGAERTQILSRGTFQETISRCLPYPPMYQDNGGWMASPFAIEDAANWLRSQGANVILLVDVLGQGEFLPSKGSADSSTENLIWIELRREMYRAKPPLVNNVIHVNTTGHPVTDFNGRRALMDAGQKAATPIVNKMVVQYGF